MTVNGAEGKKEIGRGSKGREAQKVRERDKTEKMCPLCPKSLELVEIRLLGTRKTKDTSGSSLLYPITKNRGEVKKTKKQPPCEERVW